jgi:hypothetical protein
MEVVAADGGDDVDAVLEELGVAGGLGVAEPGVIDADAGGVLDVEHPAGGGGFDGVADRVGQGAGEVAQRAVAGGVDVPVIP